MTEELDLVRERDRDPALVSLAKQERELLDLLPKKQRRRRELEDIVRNFGPARTRRLAEGKEPPEGDTAARAELAVVERQIEAIPNALEAIRAERAAALIALRRRLVEPAKTEDARLRREIATVAAQLLALGDQQARLFQGAEQLFRKGQGKVRRLYMPVAPLEALTQEATKPDPVPASPPADTVVARKVRALGQLSQTLDADPIFAKCQKAGVDLGRYDWNAGIGERLRVPERHAKLLCALGMFELSPDPDEPRRDPDIEGEQAVRDYETRHLLSGEAWRAAHPNYDGVAALADASAQRAAEVSQAEAAQRDQERRVLDERRAREQGAFVERIRQQFAEQAPTPPEPGATP